MTTGLAAKLSAAFWITVNFMLILGLPIGVFGYLVYWVLSGMESVVTALVVLIGGIATYVVLANLRLKHEFDAPADKRQ